MKDAKGHGSDAHGGTKLPLHTTRALQFIREAAEREHGYGKVRAAAHQARVGAIPSNLTAYGRQSWIRMQRDQKPSSTLYRTDKGYYQNAARDNRGYGMPSYIGSGGD